MITVVFEFPGVTTSQYDDLGKRLNVSDANPPQGLVFHCASSTGSSLLITDVWESEESFRKFGERLMPAMEATGIAKATPKIYQTHNAIQGRVPAHR